MLQDVLAVAGAVFQAPQRLDQLRVHVADAEVENGLLADLADVFRPFPFPPWPDLFDAAGVDASSPSSRSRDKRAISRRKGSKA